MNDAGERNFSDLLREVIHSLRLKDIEFAQQCGIKKATLSNYVNGKSFPDWQTLREIVRVFGINPSWLLTGEGEMFTCGSPQVSKNFPEEEVSERLTPEQRNMLTYKRLQTELGMDKPRIAEGIEAIVMGKRPDTKKSETKSGFGEGVGFSEMGGDGIGDEAGVGD